MESSVENDQRVMNIVAIAMRQEFGGWRWFGVAFLYQTALAWGMALLVHQGGRLLGLGG